MSDAPNGWLILDKPRGLGSTQVALYRADGLRVDLAGNPVLLVRGLPEGVLDLVANRLVDVPGPRPGRQQGGATQQSSGENGGDAVAAMVRAGRDGHAVSSDGDRPR